MTLLSEVIAELNDRFGLGLGTSDEILVSDLRKCAVSLS